MATPLEPKFARSLATKPSPEDRSQANGGNTVHPPGPPPDAPVPTKKPFKPWPTRETPLSQTQAANFLTPPPTEDWEEPAVPLASANGEYPGDGYSSFAGVVADPAAYQREPTARTQDQGIRMDLGDSSPLFPGRRPLYKRSTPLPSADEQLENVIEFLQKLQSNIRKAVPEVDEPSPSALGSTLLQLRRLSRTGVVPDHFEIGVLPRPPKVEVAPPVEVMAEPARAETVAPKEILPPPKPVGLKRRDVVWLALTGVLCVVTLGLVAYLWTRIGLLPRAISTPRNPVARATPGQAPVQEISEEALSLANLALEAIQQGDFKRASDVLAKAQKGNVVLPGLYYQAALLALNQGQNQEGDNFLERSIRANEAVSDCWYVRANTIFFTEGPAQAAEAFEQAVAAAPFNPRYHFFLAECLRRHGNAVTALKHFQQALRCRPNSSDTELILFKIGLTKIETSTDVIFKTELHDRLAQEPVSGDTLLLAAADAISRNEFPEAADFLRRAALVLPPRIFQSRLRDYVFRAQAKQPDIAAVLKLTLSAATPAGQPTQRPGRTLVDPATRSLAEADPGGW